MSIEKQLCRIAEGDDRAFEELYLSTRRGVYAFLYTYFHNHHDTEDAVQSVYLKVKRSIHQYDASRGNGRAWLLQIAKNHAKNELRRNAREESMEDPDLFCAPSSDPLPVTDMMERVLTEEERRLIVLHVLWGYKHRELARMLDIPTGTVTSKYKRAIEKLRRAWKQEV